MRRNRVSGCRGPSTQELSLWNVGSSDDTLGWGLNPKAEKMKIEYVDPYAQAGSEAEDCD